MSFGQVKCIICIYKCYPFPAFPQICLEIPHNYFCFLAASLTKYFLGCCCFPHLPVTPTYRWWSCTDWCELPGRRVEMSFEVWSWSEDDLLWKQCWRVAYYTSMSYWNKNCKLSFFFSFSHSPDSSYETMTSKWPSVWVKISSSWIGIVLYVWTLVAPLVLTNRDFD